MKIGISRATAYRYVLQGIPKCKLKKIQKLMLSQPNINKSNSYDINLSANKSLDLITATEQFTNALFNTNEKLGLEIENLKNTVNCLEKSINILFSRSSFSVNELKTEIKKSQKSHLSKKGGLQGVGREEVVSKNSRKTKGNNKAIGSSSKDFKHYTFNLSSNKNTAEFSEENVKYPYLLDVMIDNKEFKDFLIKQESKGIPLNLEWKQILNTMYVHILQRKIRRFGYGDYKTRVNKIYQNIYTESQGNINLAKRLVELAIKSDWAKVYFKKLY